jgi:hypothetical protein
LATTAPILALVACCNSSGIGPNSSASACCAGSGGPVARVASASVSWPKWEQGIAVVYGKDNTLFFVAGIADPVRVDGKIKNFLKRDGFLMLQDPRDALRH